MIKVYPNKLATSQPDVYSVDAPHTLLEFFKGLGLQDGVELDSLPVTVWCQGEQVLPSQWKDFDACQDIEIYREPKGTDPFSITFALIFGAKALLSALMPKIPSLGAGRSGSGDPLDEASSKGNKVKINDVVPECAGFNRRYPDYIVPPRTYFTEPKAQWIEMLLNIGVGQYQIQPSTIKSGETPLLSLGDDAEFHIYQPGADLSGEPAHYYWYPAPEVGTGSTGSAGLDLTVTSALTFAATASVFNYNSTTLSIPTGAGSFPSDWEAGLLLAVADPYQYTIADGTGDAGRDIISGGDVANLGFVPGDLIEIQGDNPGLYVVHSLTSTQLQLDYDGGAPATGLTIGPSVMAIAFRGLKYQIVSYSAQSLIVQRIKTDGSVDASWPGWVSLSSNVGRVQLDSSNLEGGYRGPFHASPPGAKVTRLEWDVLLPGGYIKFNSKGSPEIITVTSVFEWRDSAIGGAWTTITHAESGATLDASGFTYGTDLPYPMVPECRIKRLPSQQPDTTKKSDGMQWYALRGLVPASSPTSYDGVTTIAIRVRGGDRISAQSESLINLECTRILAVLNGNAQWGAPVPTRQISAWVAYIAKSVGYSDSDLDLAELQRLENIWTARGDVYDNIITDSSTVKDSMISVLNVGFTDLTLDRGVITPVRDQLRVAPNHIYDPMNMTKALKREAAYPTPDDFDGVDVEYLDSTTWAKETVQCRLPGDLGTRVDKVSIDGVTNRDRAWRLGMRRRAIQKWQNIKYSFSTELDALNSNFGDYAALGDAVIGYGQSAFMKSFIASGDTYVIGTSETFDWSAGGVFMMSIRRKDGTVSGPYVATRVGERTVSISKSDFDANPVPFVPDLSGVQEPPFLRFGPQDRWYYPALITEVSPSGTTGCKVTAVNYDPRIYQFDDGFADN